MSARFIPLILALVTLTAWATAEDRLEHGDWPQFRGLRASGVAEAQHPSTHWDVATDVNIRWKTAIPGLGHASPIITGNRVFIVTAVGSEENPGLEVGLYGDIRPVPDEGLQSWRLYCLNKQTGHIDWERTVHEAVPAIKRHTKATHANSTPATDGRYVVVFLGSEGLYCYDLCGRLVWKKDLGVLDSGYYVVPAAQWGFGSSPIIYQDMVIVQCDVQQDSFLAAFDIRQGDELWRVPREDVPTWSTPTIVDGARPQLIVNGCRHAGGYDPFTGQELWRLAGGGDIPVPTPIAAGDLIFLTSATDGSHPCVRCGRMPRARSRRRRHRASNTWPGINHAMGFTCRPRWSTKACCMPAAIMGSSVAMKRQRASGCIANDSMPVSALPPRPWRRTAKFTLPAKMARCWWHGLDRRSSYCSGIPWAKSVWPRRRSPTICCSFARSTTSMRLGNRRPRIRRFRVVLLTPR